MAIEKMALLQLVGSLDKIYPILKELIICENVHLNSELNNAYSNNFLVHEFESETNLIGTTPFNLDDFDKILNDCKIDIQTLENICSVLDINLKIDIKTLSLSNYDINEARVDLKNIISSIGEKAEKIKEIKNEISELLNYNEKIKCIYDQNLNIDKITDLNYFEYEIGTLSAENKWRIKKNYENLSAIVLRIGIIKSSVEDMYIIIYPKQFKEETNNLLKSLSWNQLKVPKSIRGTPTEMAEQINSRISELNKELEKLSKILEVDKEENKYILNKIYNVIKLEEKITEVEKSVDFGDNLFILNIWIPDKDKKNIEESIGRVTNKFIITEKSANELGKQVKPPTKLKNNWFTKPFEIIVKMYGLPSYHEIDPTPFLALTYTLIFGIMFGDIGQGLVYFLAGVFLSQKIDSVGQLLMRLGGSSILFGFIYGSLFGLEKHELPWLPSLVGKVLDPKNIPSILLTGVIVGIIVLTISYIFGIVNHLRKGDVKEGIFGKNGIIGYLFFISLIIAVICITKLIKLSVIVPILIMIISLIVMVLKEPLTNIILNKKPLIHGNTGSYFTESIFECVETILNALSNAISFIRVGAFALNHAGLFLAFLVMSELTTNIVLKILILVIGNILILTLEGLIVFIQGLRLQYYEMFSKYFSGDGIEFDPIKLKK